MKKFLTLTIIAIIALIGLSVSVNAADVATKADLKNAVLTDGTIKLTDNIEITESIRTSTNITVDLNGFRITGPDDGKANWYAFIVEGGVFTLKDSSTAQTGEIYAKCFGIETKAGTFIMESGKIVATKNQGIGAAVVNYGGKVEIKGGTLVAAFSAVDCQSFFADAELVITGGTFETTLDTDAAIDIGGEYSNGNETVTIIGGAFKGINAFAVNTNADVSITGGAFSSDISDYKSAGYIVNYPVYKEEFDMDMYEVKLNTPYGTQDAINTPDGNFEMLLVSEEFDGQLDSIFEQEIEKNEALKKALLDGKLVNINVQMNKVEEEDVNEDELKAMKEAAKEGKFVKFYDITLQMIANQTEDLGTISELSNKLTFKVLVPDELVKDGRTFFMYRYHDGKVEKITGELDEENYFTFESDKFSTYALAYEDKVDEPTAGGQGTAEKEPEKDETPKTGSIDVVLFASAIVAIISVAGIVAVKKYTR